MILFAESWFKGQPYRILEMEKVAFDEPLGPETFEQTHPAWPRLGGPWARRTLRWRPGVGRVPDRIRYVVGAGRAEGSLLRLLTRLATPKHGKVLRIYDESKSLGGRPVEALKQILRHIDNGAALLAN